jgi:hypothetical protein
MHSLPPVILLDLDDTILTIMNSAIWLLTTALTGSVGF